MNHAPWQPKSKGDEDKIMPSFQKLMEEDLDPAGLDRDEQTGEMHPLRHGPAPHRDRRGQGSSGGYGVEVDLKTAQGPLQGDHQGQAPRSRASTRSRPAAAASSATAGSGWSPPGSRQRLRVRRRDRGRRHPASSTSRPWKRASIEAMQRGLLWPATPSSTSR
ncbi:MAG: hypothetical protein MZU79_00195 [Anaerotruncus sp.]|nr:hypothetical protein [Anaerotruncus sp.]